MCTGAGRAFGPLLRSGGSGGAWGGGIQMQQPGAERKSREQGRVQSIQGNRGSFCQAAENNKEYIGEVLQQHLLASGFAEEADKPLFILEVASGTGQHIAHFFAKLSSKRSCVWQPSDYVSDAFPSIRYYVEEAEQWLSRDETVLKQSSYVLDPILLDVTHKSWGPHSENFWCKPQRIAARSDSSTTRKEDTLIPQELRVQKNSLVDAVFNSNMVHITSYKCCECIFSGVKKVCSLRRFDLLFGSSLLFVLFTFVSAKINLDFTCPEL